MLTQVYFRHSAKSVAWSYSESMCVNYAGKRLSYCTIYDIFTATGVHGVGQSWLTAGHDSYCAPT